MSFNNLQKQTLNNCIPYTVEAVYIEENEDCNLERIRLVFNISDQETNSLLENLINSNTDDFDLLHDMQETIPYYQTSLSETDYPEITEEYAITFFIKYFSNAVV